MIIINIGGEGEVPGAINVNSFVALRRPLGEIRRRGLVIGGDFTQLPIASGVADAIVGNHIPVLGASANATMNEAFRVLRPGGTVRVHASSGGGGILVDPMREAGFVDVDLIGLHASGRRP